MSTSQNTVQIAKGKGNTSVDSRDSHSHRLHRLGRVSPESSLVQAEQPKFCQPVFREEVLQPSDHLYGLSWTPSPLYLSPSMNRSSHTLRKCREVEWKANRTSHLTIDVAEVNKTILKRNLKSACSSQSIPERWLLDHYILGCLEANNSNKK